MKEQRRHDSLERHRRNGAGDDAAADEECAATDDQLDDLTWRRAKRDADTDLASAHGR